VRAVAVPIYNAKAEVVAALNVVTPVARAPEEYLMTHILPLLQETARGLRQSL